MTLILITALAMTTTATTAVAHPRVSGISPAGKKIRALVYRSDQCLAQIIDRETGGTWNPRIYNGFGHWHPGDPPSNRSYGLPQAQPPEKMARYGKDWRTSWRTQLKWAREYAVDRYGSACAALAFWLRNRWW